MSGLSRTPGKRVYGESRTVGSNPTLSATTRYKLLFIISLTGNDTRCKTFPESPENSDAYGRYEHYTVGTQK